ncbi:MAG: hypothetical protein JXM75_08985 [Chromatiaceae bacterium]|nr:hypothetical protein [Chromatiaceae bacterium]
MIEATDAPIEAPRLALNFAQDFLPERRLLAALLAFAADGGAGDKLTISERTGIPTGESTGKVEPMIHFARAMGLIQAARERDQWSLRTTLLGRRILAEDPWLSEPVTLWLLHLLLCRRQGREEPARGVADAWFALFADGEARLGNPFGVEDYQALLAERHGAKGYLRRLASLVPRAYLESGCLGPIELLIEAPSTAASSRSALGYFRREPAPVAVSHFPAYTAWLFLLWDQLYPDDHQLAMDDLFAEARVLALLGWGQGAASRWMQWMANQGWLQLDRKTGATLALRLRLRSTQDVIAHLYDELA